MLYDKHEVKYLMEKCINCNNYSWEGKHVCDDSYTQFKAGKHEIYCDTIFMCASAKAFDPVVENWWMIK